MKELKQTQLAIKNRTSMGLNDQNLGKWDGIYAFDSYLICFEKKAKCWKTDKISIHYFYFKQVIKQTDNY